MNDHIEYPTRCMIVDVDSDPMLRTPDASRPYLGKLGVAQLLANGDVQIDLDDGGKLMGYECWWTPITDENDYLVKLYRSVQRRKA